ATRSAPIPTADPFRVCASVAIAGGAARHQQFGLPLEQLQDFLFKATVVESHARKVPRSSTVYPCVAPLRSTTSTAARIIPASRSRYLLRGLWPDRDQIQVNKRRA